MIFSDTSSLFCILQSLIITDIFKLNVCFSLIITEDGDRQGPADTGRGLVRNRSLSGRYHPYLESLTDLKLLSKQDILVTRVPVGNG